MTFLPFSTTGIGSMPHEEASQACELIMEYFDIPFWPQLPKYSPRESMIAQYSEGFPCLIVESDRVFLKKDEEKIIQWLSEYSDDLSIPIGEDYAKGLYVIADRLKGKRLRFFKGQITGPVTFALSLKDEEGKPIYFDETLRELTLLHLKAKVRWQIDFLGNFADEVLIFIDEPILQAVGTSAYIAVEQAESMRLITEMVSFIKSLNAKVGLHCCGRADWKDVLSSGIDILSFDAFFFFDFLKSYKDDLEEFLKKGGFVAWGFVPTTDDIYSLSDEDIISAAKRKIKEFEREIPLINKNSLISPSCGMGSLDIEASQRVCRLLQDLKNSLLND